MRPRRIHGCMDATQRSDRDIRDMAEARVGFKRHAFTFVAVNLFFVALWWLTSDSRTLSSYWPIWPLLGWGLGLASHAWCVYGGGGEDAVAREEARIRAALRP